MNQDNPHCSGCEGVPNESAKHTRRWLRIGASLVFVTMLYNVAEAVIATSYGVKAESVALFGFGLDSVIECAAASLMLWRLLAQIRGASGPALERKEKAVRRFVGGTFIALALYIVVQSVRTLWGAGTPEKSVVGIGLATASLVLMPSVAMFKLRAARELGSRALRAEAKETLVCSYLSFTLLVGLGANAAFGWWWADPVAALIMVPWMVKEGREGIRGKDCCDED